MKQILTEFKGEIHSSTIRVGDFKTLFIIMDKTTRQNKQENRGLEQYYKSTIPDRHIQNMPT